jgi:predicted DNA-binding transcriptional regulator AlpA
MDYKLAEIDCVRSRQETADILGVSLRTLRRMELDGNAPPRVKISERIFGFRASDINKFLASRVVSNSAA